MFINKDYLIKILQDYLNGLIKMEELRFRLEELIVSEKISIDLNYKDVILLVMHTISNIEDTEEFYISNMSIRAMINSLSEDNNPDIMFQKIYTCVYLDEIINIIEKYHVGSMTKENIERFFSKHSLSEKLWQYIISVKNSDIDKNIKNLQKGILSDELF